MRTGGSPSPFALTPSLVPSEPLPTGAIWSSFTASIALQWSIPIVDAPVLDVANWWARINNKLQVVSAVNAVANVVTLSVTDGAVDVGPDVVSYRPPPYDVVGTNGVPAPAFEDYPVVVFG